MSQSWAALDPCAEPMGEAAENSSPVSLGVFSDCQVCDLLNEEYSVFGNFCKKADGDNLGFSDPFVSKQHIRFRHRAQLRLKLTEMAAPTEDKYDGDWSGDVRQGQGKCLFANGDSYSGAWQSDLREGAGALTCANGDGYDGDWHSDMRCGKGNQKYANTETYSGDWLNDVRHGDGKAHVVSDKYEGGTAEYSGAWLDDL